MSASESAKKVVLYAQLAFFAVCIVFGIILWASGARPAKSPEYRVTMTADEKYQNCITQAAQQPDALQENAMMTCSEVNWTDSVEAVNP